ncbi:MAG: hypothetical protein ACOVKV_11355 [Novosphingobium sp.]
MAQNATGLTHDAPTYTELFPDYSFGDGAIGDPRIADHLFQPIGNRRRGREQLAVLVDHSSEQLARTR